MKAAVAYKHKAPLRIEERPTPAPGPGQVLIRVKAAGVCHSDLHIIDGDWEDVALPRVPGHEVAGYVEAVGPQVAHLKVGDRVGMPWNYSACGHCDACIEGEEGICAEHESTGVTVDGGYAEYLLAPADYATPIPVTIPYEEAAPLFCAGVTVYRGLKAASPKPGERVVVHGVGGLGHLAVQFARLAGAHVIALTRSAEKAKAALEIGAHETLLMDQGDPVLTLRELGGADIILSSVISQNEVGRLFPALADRGRFVLLGAAPGTITLDPFDLIPKRTSLIGSAVGNRKELREVLALAAQGRIRARVEMYPLEQVNEALDRVRQGKARFRAVLTP